MVIRPLAFKDRDENLYQITINGKIYLTLNKEKKVRFIGYLDRYTKTFKKNRKNTHIFYKTREFGFPYELLKFLIENGEVEEIEIDLGNEVYRLKVSEGLLKDSSFRYFKKQGYERQIFIPIADFEKE